MANVMLITFGVLLNLWKKAMLLGYHTQNRIPCKKTRKMPTS